MPRHGYGEDTELLNAVIDCMSRKLTDKVAVDELNSRGLEIHPKKYQRVKAYVRKTMPQRLENLPYYEYQVSLIDSIDTVNALENYLKLRLASAKVASKIMKISTIMLANGITTSLSSRRIGVK